MKNSIRPKVFVYLFIFLFMPLFIGCETFKLKSRDEVEVSATPAPYPQMTLPAGKIPPATNVTSPTLPSTEPQSSDSGFKTSTPPKIGIIVGPGHLRSFIAVGILQELQKAKMPVQAVVGLEWGALPAALFSLHGQANEVEWQMMKLKEKDFPQKALISQKIESESISRLDEFLNEAFSNSQFEQMKIPFTCLSLDLNKRQYFWMKRGEIRKVLPNCIAHPPYFFSESDQVAGIDLKLSADYLKQQGAQFIIFINLVPITGNLFEKSEIPLTSEVLWANQQQNLARYAGGNIDYVIDTTLVGNKALDFANRREMILKGQEIGRNTAKKILPKLGF